MDFINTHTSILEYNSPDKNILNIKLILFYEDIFRSEFYDNPEVLIVSLFDYTNSDEIYEYINNIDKHLITSQHDIKTNFSTVYLKKLNNTKIIFSILKNLL